jgi:hypothetical protein
MTRVADVSSFIVGPNLAIPEQAQINGAVCHGIINIGTFFTQCVSP